MLPSYCNLRERTYCLSVYYNSFVNTCNYIGSTGTCKSEKNGICHTFRTWPVLVFSDVIIVDPHKDSVRKYHYLPSTDKQIVSQRNTNLSKFTRL